MVRQRLCLALMVASLTLPLFAQSKQPWEWTIDERLADRFDPAKIREREEAYVAAHPQIRSMPERPLGKDELRYRIDGRRNLELLLPHELFDSLLRSLLSNDEKSRTQWNARLKSAGFDPDHFWPDLESVSAGYLPLLDRTVSGRSNAFEQCHARFESLNAARNLFGAERFDRMTYAVVAPHTQCSEGTTVRDPAKRLRSEANGCDDFRD